jgi:class 3 adenylate cyclase
LTKELGKEIIISKTTRSRLEDDLPLKELPAARVKGKSQPVEIYALA